MRSPLSVGQWRGLVILTKDAVVETSRAVERVHRQTAGRTFGVLERVPVVATPALIVRSVHDATLTSVYAIIRLTTSVASMTIAAALDGILDREPDTPE